MNARSSYEGPADGGGRRAASAGKVRLFVEPVLVVGQRPRTVDGTLEYPICDRTGARVGSLVDVGRRALRAAFRPEQLMGRAAGTEAGGLLDALRWVSSVPRDVSYRLELRDADGAVLIVLTGDGWRERTNVTVSHPNGREIGRIVKDGGLGKARFALLIAGERVGVVIAEQWWTVGHRILDRGGRELARVAPSPLGWLARARGVKSRSFVVEVHACPDDALRALVVAATVSADTALKRPEPVDVTGG